MFFSSIWFFFCSPMHVAGLSKWGLLALAERLESEIEFHFVSENYETFIEYLNNKFSKNINEGSNKKFIATQASPKIKLAGKCLIFMKYFLLPVPTLLRVWRYHQHRLLQWFNLLLCIKWSHLSMNLMLKMYNSLQYMILNLDYLRYLH